MPPTLPWGMRRGVGSGSWPAMAAEAPRLIRWHAAVRLPRGEKSPRRPLTSHLRQRLRAVLLLQRWQRKAPHRRLRCHCRCPAPPRIALHVWRLPGCLHSCGRHPKPRHVTCLRPGQLKAGGLMRPPALRSRHGVTDRHHHWTMCLAPAPRCLRPHWQHRTLLYPHRRAQHSQHSCHDPGQLVPLAPVSRGPQ